MAVRPEEIASILKQQIEQFGAPVTTVGVGTVIEAGDGIRSLSSKGTRARANNSVATMTILVHGSDRLRDRWGAKTSAGMDSEVAGGSSCSACSLSW